MTTCPRCGRTFGFGFREGNLPGKDQPLQGGERVELDAGDPPPAHFVTKPEPGKPLPQRCWEEKWVRR